MSDSYKAWCEECERAARMFSEENVADVKNTRAFKLALAKAKKAAENTKLYKVKSCENCAHNSYLNRKNVCLKLCTILCRDHNVCKHWKKKCGENQNGFTPIFNEDVIAWSIIQKHKFEYGY